jgi:hypothetical protein
MLKNSKRESGLLTLADDAGKFWRINRQTG